MIKSLLEKMEDAIQRPVPYEGLREPSEASHAKPRREQLPETNPPDGNPAHR
jgi:hypothetical protein